MKRAGNLWPKVFNKYEAQEAVITAIKFKKNNKHVEKLLLSKDPSLYHYPDMEKVSKYTDECLEMLQNKTWVHREPAHKYQFCKNSSKAKGKWRDLYIPSLRDHCIAHIVMKQVEPIIVKGMHPYCCGSVPGRGIKHVNRSIKKWIKRDSKNCRYFVKLDIRKFFDSITKELMMSCFKRYIKDKDILWALSEIVYSAPKACPIGYYTSPWFGNLLLQDLDWYIEQELYKIRRDSTIKWVKHYVRYVDDMLLFGSSKADLYKAVRAIKKFLKSKYNLDLKNTWEIKELGRRKSIKYGVDICGYRFYKDCTILRDGIFLSAKRLCKQIYKQGYIKRHQAMSLLSKVGWSKWCNFEKFLDEFIRPYTNIKYIRRLLGHVARVGKWGFT